MTNSSTKTETPNFSFFDISPEHLNAEQAKCFANDIARLQTYKSEFVQVPCPACASSRSVETFEKFQMNYVKCLDCETMYINPRPSPRVLEIYYSTSENYAFWNKYIFPASEQTRKEKIFTPRVDRLIEICERYKIRHDTLFEVGCGFGTFCEVMKERQFFKRVIGVEPTPDLAQTCRDKGLEVIEKPIEKVVWTEGPVDLIASFETIEHLFCPKDFLLHCFSLLAPSGLLVLTCPNVKGFDIQVLQAASDAVDVEHLNYFHIDSLSGLLRKCGFIIEEAMTPGKLDAELVRLKALNKEFDLSSTPFLQQVLIDRWETAGAPFQRFLAENNLSSHMWIVARKPK